MHKASTDRYQLQKIALLAACKNFQPDKLVNALQGLSVEEQEQLLELIIDQGLQFFWLESLKVLKDLSFPSMSREKLRSSCLESTTGYLTQKKVLMEVDALLNEAGCDYAVYKGAHVREVVYHNPVNRPSVDIDLLISPDDKRIVLHTLITAGFTMHPDPANISHEVNLQKDGVYVDLHWDIMRPGRTRIDVALQFLQTRQRQDFFWSLDNETALFIMLVHPVFTKYSTAPQAAIVRLVDISHWLDCKTINWSELVRLVDVTGMKTACWVTMTFLEDMTGQKFPQSFYESVVPGRMKMMVLRYWLRHNLSLKFDNYPVITKYIFTVLAHDSIVDALRFFRRAWQAKRQRQAMLDDLGVP